MTRNESPKTSNNLLPDRKKAPFRVHIMRPNVVREILNPGMLTCGEVYGIINKTG